MHTYALETFKDLIFIITLVTMVRQGIIDDLLEILSSYASSSIVNDRQLVLFHSLLLQLHVKGKEMQPL